MAVLVTGGAGYIGSHMVLALLDAGERVVVLDDLSTGFRWAVDPRATFVLGDVSDRATVLRLVEEHAIAAVIHFAARIVVPDSVADPLGYYLANTVKTRALLDSVVAAGVPHFIFSSTAAVYGMVGIEPVSEDAVLAPISPYGRSKLMSEWMLQDTAAAFPLNYVALRYFNGGGGRIRLGRTGQSTAGATRSCSTVACETARRQASGDPGLRDRLSHPGRHLPAGLYPCDGSRRRPSGRFDLSAGRRHQRHL